MNITKYQVLSRFNGRLPQLFPDNVFLPKGADGLGVNFGDSGISYRYHHSASGRVNWNKVIRGEPVTVEGYRHRGVMIMGAIMYCWVRADIAAGFGSLSISVVPHDPELDWGIQQ